MYSQILIYYNSPCGTNVICDTKAMFGFFFWGGGEHLVKCGILYVNDILDHNGNILTLNSFTKV